MKKNYLKTIAIAILLLIFAFGLIRFPKDVLTASLRGVNMWWGIVFPSLLPFLIISDLFISFGVVSLIGGILEPIMRPLFRVPGVGGFVLALGMISGFPSGAKMTATLRKQDMLTRSEAERLVCYTNAANPLFIFGAVAVGFLHEPELGALLALAHYGGNLAVGLIMRFYHANEEVQKSKKERGILRQAFLSMHEIRMKESRPFGKILGDAVSTSIQTLWMIGGFIILFSVLNKLLFKLGIIPILVALLTDFFHLLSVSVHLISPAIAGFFEMTLGSQLASNSHATLFQTVVAISGILGFSGLSIHAQVASILADTDIRYRIFFVAKCIHGSVSMLISAVLFKEMSWIKDVFYMDPQFQTSPFYWNMGPVVTIFSILIYIWLQLRRQKNHKN